jgi:hypothetical protein
MDKSKNMFGLLTVAQADFITAMMSGPESVEEAAEAAGVAPSTGRKWLRRDHLVRRELMRRVRARDRLLDTLVKTIDDNKSTPWMRLEAAQRLQAVLGLDPESVRLRAGRCRERQWARERSRRADAGPGGPYGPAGAVGAAGEDDPSAAGPVAAP